MSDDSWREVAVERINKGRYRAVNARGASVEFGTAEEAGFTPVELLLAAIAGCSAIDVDFITSKRAEPQDFSVVAGGDTVRDEGGKHLTNLSTTFDISFPSGAEGDAARGVLPRAVAQSHDRLCTVSRTVELGEQIATRIEQRT